MKPSKETYPRIVSNGKWYRIETSHQVYDYIYVHLSCVKMTWETCFIWRAIKRLTRMRRDEQHANPDNWKPVI